MALPMSHVYLCRSGLNLIFKNNKGVQTPLVSSSRQLRGSKLGRKYFFRRDVERMQERWKNFVKTVNEQQKPTSDRIKEFKVSVINVDGEKDLALSIQNDTVRNANELDDTYKRLEGRITPLKKLPYVRQIERKYNKCLTLLRMYGERLRCSKMPITMAVDRLPFPVDLMLSSKQINGYRNQDEFSIGTGIDGNPKTVGFYLKNFTGENELICVGPEELLIIKDIHKAFIKDFQSYIQDSPLSACVQNSEHGFWKNITVRSNKSEELMGVITVQSQSLTSEQLAEEKLKLKTYFENSELSYKLKSLYFQASSGSYELLLGSPTITEDVNGIQCTISPDSFFYSNTTTVEAICRSLRKLCRVNSTTTVVEVFCGTGPVSLTFSPFVKKCIGIDVLPQTIDDAKRNAELNNRHNAEFLQGQPENILSKVFQKDYHEDLLVIINSGKFELSKSAIRQLRECKHLKKIVYVSLKPRVAIDNFTTLSRPCGKERSLGRYFIPVLAIPVDTAPQTEHFGLIIMYQRLSVP